MYNIERSMKSTRPFLGTLCLLALVTGEMLTAASMLKQPIVHSDSSDSTKTPIELLVMMTKRMDELERSRSADVYKLNKRIEDLSESRKHDALDMARLKQEVEELKRFRDQDFHRITLLSEQLTELKRHCETDEEAEDYISNQAYIPDRDGTQYDNISDVTLPSPSAAPSSDVSATNEEDSSAHLADTSNSKSVSGQHRIRSRHRRIVRLDRLTDNIVAFHVVLTEPISHPLLGQAIAFNHLATNSGSVNYNTNTGVFTCSQSGLYVFSWSVSVWGHQFIYSNLVRNNDTIGSAQVGQATTWDSATSATVVTHLEVRDRVSVRIGSHVIGTKIYPYCSMLTGFRLQ